MSSGIAGENRAPTQFRLSDKRCRGRLYRLAEIGVSLPCTIFERHENEPVLKNGVKRTRKVFFVNWNVRSLFREGFLMTVLKEISKSKFQ
jgi:hypothetical protein